MNQPINLPTCTFVILGYNNLELTRTTLLALGQHLHPRHHILLYDNNSPQSLAKVAEECQVAYFRSETNTGYAEGNNQAARLALQHFPSDLICFMNNDVIINHEFGHQLESRLTAWIIDPALAAMQPYLYLDEHLTQLENAGIHYYRTGLTRQNRSLKEPSQVLNGACLFIKTTVIESLFQEDGFVFQPSYFMYAEDVELGLRLKRRGFSLLVDEQLKAQHLESSSLSTQSVSRFFFYWRNLLTTLVLTRSWQQLLVDAPFIIWGQLILVGLSWRMGRFGLVFKVYASLAKQLRTLDQVGTYLEV